jgi:putative ATP-dependent endonuclease of OLD family
VKIRHIEIMNFRGIRELAWAPSPHVNCLIGPGDAGKTTIIDAIELALAPRHQVTFDDCDFYGAQPEHPIDIMITLGELPLNFTPLSKYGEYTRGWNAQDKTIVDEPDEASGLELVLSTQLTVDRTLEP